MLIKIKRWLEVVGGDFMRLGKTNKPISTNFALLKMMMLTYLLETFFFCFSMVPPHQSTVSNVKCPIECEVEI